MNVPNVLAERYATAALREIWSPEGKVRLERDLWIAVLEAQRDAGLPVSPGAIEAYRAARDTVDLEAIARRERVTRHDVKARIETFCELAGFEEIHRGMTSRDLTENVEQLQIYRSLEHLEIQAGAALLALAQMAESHASAVITARTHNVAAQLTTLGRRAAMFGEELLLGCRQLRLVRETYPVRGLKGAVGTQLDLLNLLDGDASRARQIEESLVRHLGIPNLLSSPGQVYPRSLDHRVAAAFVEVASGPSNFARTLRLMAGHETASEGFAKGQVGSSAMPHKMNSRSCERINGFHSILKGHLTMVDALAGDQWNEGDVSCSVVRRVALPDSCFALNGLLETFLVVLDQFTFFPAVAERENAHYLPFLLSTTFLMEAVRQGIGRETAHEAIKEHAVAAVTALRRGDTTRNDFVERLASDERLGFTEAGLLDICREAASRTGASATQIHAFSSEARDWAAHCPQAANYRPGTIL